MNKRYSVDVKLTGFVNVTVEAASAEEAMDKAREKFIDEYMEKPIYDLRWKSTELDVVSDPKTEA